MTLYFKVLRSTGQATYTDAVWPTPGKFGDTEIPGAWVEHTGPLAMCASGLHLTADPSKWFERDCVVYVAEIEGEIIEGHDKIVCRKARLLRRATQAELAPFKIFFEGKHSVSDGQTWAYGSATVYASGSAMVYASGSAMVTAFDAAMVTASDAARVIAYDWARVIAYDWARVTASGSATVTRY